MDRAVELRQGLADPAQPMTLWELANSLLLRGKVSCLLGVRVRLAIEDLVSAWRIAKQLEGPIAENLRRDLDQAMAVVERAYPTVVATVRWPSRFRGPS
jgi:hypothetical protein